MLEADQDRRVVMPDQNRVRRQIAVQEGLVTVTRRVQLLHCPDGATGEAHPRHRVPLVVLDAFDNAGCCRIGHREERHLTRITRLFLERVDDAGRPRVLLQVTQRIVFAPCLRLGIRFVTGRQVVKMQDYTLLPRSVRRSVDAVEPLVRRRLQFQARVAGEPCQITRHGYAATRLQQARRHPDLRRRQHRRDIDGNRFPPHTERAETNAAHASAG